MAIDNTPMLTSVLVQSAKLRSDIKDSVTSATIELSTDQVSQLTFEMIDPSFSILKSGIFTIGNSVKYGDLSFLVAGVDVGSNSGNEQITIKCRPKVVQSLKKRVGTKVLKSASPSDFVRAECKAVGAKYLIQPSGKRKQVARDKVKSGEKYEADDKPSSWTTFKRLADELGFVIFECSGVIYFGKPTWLLSKSKASPMLVTWKGKYSRYEAEMVPACSKSVDNKETTVNVILPLERAKEARVGRTLQLSGIPYFNGYYLIDSVDFDLAGEENRLQVTASTAIDPEKQKKSGSSKSKSSKKKSSGGSIKSKTTNSKGSRHYPLSRKYRAGTPYGRRGNWAAGYHTGTDFPAPTGAPVYAVYNGTIAIGGWGSAYGKHVRLRVAGKGQYAYCHLSRISVRSGQEVKAGDRIGYVGSTGRATGPHLHLEKRVSPYRYGKDSRNPMS